MYNKRNNGNYKQSLWMFKFDYTFKGKGPVHKSMKLFAYKIIVQ